MTNTLTYYSDKVMLAQFVNDLLENSNLDWQSITVTKQVKSGEFSVSIVTDMSSEDTDESIQDYFARRWNT